MSSLAPRTGKKHKKSGSNFFKNIVNFAGDDGDGGDDASTLSYESNAHDDENPTDHNSGKHSKKLSKVDQWFWKVMDDGAFDIFETLKSASLTPSNGALQKSAHLAFRILAFGKGVQHNKSAFRGLALDAAGVVVDVYRSFQKAEDKTKWPEKWLAEEIIDLMKLLDQIRDFMEKSSERSSATQKLMNTAGQIQVYRKALESSVRSLRRKALNFEQLMSVWERPGNDPPESPPTPTVSPPISDLEATLAKRRAEEQQEIIKEKLRKEEEERRRKEDEQQRADEGKLEILQQSKLTMEQTDIHSKIEIQTEMQQQPLTEVERWQRERDFEEERFKLAMKHEELLKKIAAQKQELETHRFLAEQRRREQDKNRRITKASVTEDEGSDVAGTMDDDHSQPPSSDEEEQSSEEEDSEDEATRLAREKQERKQARADARKAAREEGERQAAEQRLAQETARLAWEEEQRRAADEARRKDRKKKKKGQPADPTGFAQPPPVQNPYFYQPPPPPAGYYYQQPTSPSYQPSPYPGSPAYPGSPMHPTMGWAPPAPLPALTGGTYTLHSGNVQNTVISNVGNDHSRNRYKIVEK